MYDVNKVQNTYKSSLQVNQTIMKAVKNVKYKHG